ncbi:MAG: amidohydrolase [Deltaproteobacteria bacterium]|nr:MAG: amidohydrolase [Deltaproteobacteria bacterium]
MVYDLIIHNGTILTQNDTSDVIEDGMICVKGSRIVRVESSPPDTPLPVPGKGMNGDKIIDARGGIIMPGLVNTHSHLPMTLLRGLADDLPLDIWLNEHIFPAEGRHVNPDMVRTGALLGAAEMLLSGTTTCCDGYFHETHVAEAIHQTGLRAVLGQGVIDFPAPGVPDPSRNIQSAADFLKQWEDRSPLIIPSVFCHSPYTCSAKTLEAAKQLSSDQGVLFQIHVAETRNETEQCLAEHGVSPVAYLNQVGILDKNTLLVHAVHLSETDISTIAATAATVSHNPESNMKLGAGIAPVPALLEEKITVGLGTDGCASNNDLDLFGEMDAAAKIHKGRLEDPTVLDAETVIRMATIDGARAIGLGDITGSLEVGKQADMVVLDTHRPHLVPLYHPESHVVYSVRGADVAYSVAAGQILVAQGKLTTLNLDEIIDDAMRIGKLIRLG